MRAEIIVALALPAVLQTTGEFSDILSKISAGLSVPTAQSKAVPSPAEAPTPTATPTPMPDDPRPPVTFLELTSIATTVRSFRPKTTFDAAPTQDLSGRRFVVELPVRAAMIQSCVSLPYWRYSAERREMELVFFGALRPTSLMKGYDGRVHPVLQGTGSYLAAPISCHEIGAGSYRASNLFGATTTIARKSQSVVEMTTARDPLKPNRTDFIMATVKMDPNEARSVVPRLRLRYEGVISHWPTGTSVACGIEHNQADMTSAWDTTVNTCIYRGFISHVAFIDVGTGKVLAERNFKTPDDH